MTSKPTIWQALAAKLGREPTNAEAKAECLRILNEAHIERASAGKLGVSAQAGAPMTYTVEQMDHANEWRVIKQAATSAAAQAEMQRCLGLSRSTAWRVVERPSGRLIVCEGGPALEYQGAHR